ncbi:hypothetical protein [Amycolatopsis sp. H20-H5]|uniref:hypothetical protein n=1 Tax=Amycolatopsis sp. H20-H5 TaxID=3046309 RepID=UPI002DBCC391|nr:hypothetical protein [Amycolatopsis sp. H20-H5]MEC3979284.1 hypothetical protein [Amycolatopsis sp. H20-H5]
MTTTSGPYANASVGQVHPIAPSWPQPATHPGQFTVDSQQQAAGRPVRVVAAAAGTAAAYAGPMAAPAPMAYAPGRPHVAQRALPRPAAAPQVRQQAPAGNRPTGYTEHLGVVQVIWWQVAVLSVLGSLRQPWPVLASVSAGAAVVLALTAIRVRGHWLYELLVLRLRFQLRARRHDLPDRADKALALLGLLRPGSSVRTIDTRQGATMVLGNEHGLTALLKPRNPPMAASFPPPADLLPGGDGQGHEFAVQAAFHSPARQGTPVRLWLAVQAVRTAEVPDDEELELALRNALRRVRRALVRAGVPTEPLPEDAGFAALTALAHVTGGRHEVREDWGFWRTGPVSQACFTVDGWAGLDGRVAARWVARLLTPTAGIAVTVTVAARSGGRTGTRESTAVLRLAAVTEAAVDSAATWLTALLAPAGLHLSRLDGDHLSGVAASLPLGGFPS